MITLKDLTKKTWYAMQIVIYDTSKKTPDYPTIKDFMESDCALYVGDLCGVQSVNYKHLLHRDVKSIGVVENHLVIGI